MLIGEGVARKGEGLNPADRASIVLIRRRRHQHIGVRGRRRLPHVLEDYDARAVKIPSSAAQELLDTKGVNVLVTSLKRTRDTDGVAKALTAALGTERLEVKRWEELNDFYAKTVDLYDRQFGVLQLIILAMVLLSVMNTVSMTVFERTGEFGTMRALGSRGKAVVGLILTESVLLGVIGAAAGVAIGIVLALVISAVGIPMPPPPNTDIAYTAQIRIVPSVIANAFFVGVAATVLAAVLPALRIARTEVVEALRHNQ